MFQKKEVLNKTTALNAIPYDIAGAEYSHYGNNCTFDFIIEKHNISDPALLQLAVIVRCADTDRFNIAQQAVGLWSISAGLSYNYKDDHEMLEIGMKIYDALYSRAKYVKQERHTWNPELLNN